MLIILAGVSLNLLIGNNGIITKAQEAKRMQEIAQIKENINMEIVAKELERVENKEELTYEDVGEVLEKFGDVSRNGDWTIKSLTPSGKDYEINFEEIYSKELAEPQPIAAQIPEKSKKSTFNRNYGVIEIQFLEGTSYKTTITPNEPNLGTNMKKVYWEEDGTERVEGQEGFDNTKWYSYIAQTGNTENGGTSKWANAVTQDESGNITGYFVWIPRYAYRIVYFDTQAHEDAYRLTGATDGIIGYSDARGFVHTDGTTPSDMKEPVTSIYVGDNKLRPHPAFEDGRKTGYTQGEWNQKLEGIWIAKYETSGSLENMQVLPGVASLSNQTIGNIYTYSLQFNKNNESHMIKNSEWGAMAYLTDSKYGRNGNPITANSLNRYTAGKEAGTVVNNPLQSTTGNYYGIYDTVGGCYEYAAAYIPDASNTNGKSFAQNQSESTKYATVYNMGALGEDSALKENYIANINKKFGDAIIETSLEGNGITAWNSEGSGFVGVNGDVHYPYFYLSGGYDNARAGIFFFSNGIGEEGRGLSCRLVLCVE